MISAYADALESRLGFDPTLARSVREEVEDHLWAAVAADPSRDSADAERRAVERFGEPRLIAAQFAAVALARQAKQTAVLVALVLGTLYVAMQSRLAWYELTEWEMCERLMDVTDTIGLIDGAAFWLAIAGSVAAWAFVGRQRVRGFLAVSSLAATAIVAAVLCDGVLTAIRLSGWDYSSDFLVPLVSMGLEVVCAVALVQQIYVAARRLTLASSALHAKPEATS